MKNSCEFDSFSAHCLDVDILHIDFKKVKKLRAQDVEDIYVCHRKLGNGNKIYVLVTFRGFVPMSDEAMAEAKKQGKDEVQAAVAYVIKNFASRMGLKFFMNFYKPKYPINVTATKSEALAWLKKQKRLNEQKG